MEKAGKSDLAIWRKQVYRRTQSDMARELGIAPGQYRNYEYRPSQRIPNDVLQQLVERGYRPNPKRPRDKSSTLQNVGLLPMLEPYPMEATTLAVPIEFAQVTFFGFVMTDDSMMPYIHEGDTCILTTCIQPRNRRPFVASASGTLSPILRDLVFEADGWLLRAWNPTHHAVRLADATLRGYLIGLFSRDGQLKIGPDSDGLTRSMLDELLRRRLP